jgi:hypothetical protein
VIVNKTDIWFAFPTASTMELHDQKPFPTSQPLNFQTMFLVLQSIHVDSESHIEIKHIQQNGTHNYDIMPYAV